MKKCAIAECTKGAEKRGWCADHYRRWRLYGAPLAGGPCRTLPGVSTAWIEKHKNFSGTECLAWPFNRTHNGYARIRVGDRPIVFVSRIMCEHRNGPAPIPKHEAAHSCGKGHLGCVNPQHLSWKTRKENHADKLVHGTAQRGERHGMVKLTETDVRAIRATFGIPQWKIAKRYGIKQAQISAIKTGRNWAWLD